MAVPITTVIFAFPACIAISRKGQTSHRPILKPENEHNLVPLFHPRKQRWLDHFHLEGDGRIVGTTPEGRATATLLNFNEEHRLQLRRALMQQDWSP
jgi:hypothetical protein